MAKHLATWCASVYRDSVLAIIAKRRTIVPLFGRRECSNEPTKLRIDDALMQAHVVAQELRGGVIRWAQIGSQDFERASCVAPAIFGSAGCAHRDLCGRAICPRSPRCRRIPIHRIALEFRIPADIDAVGAG